MAIRTSIETIKSLIKKLKSTEGTRQITTHRKLISILKTYPMARAMKNNKVVSKVDGKYVINKALIINDELCQSILDDYIKDDKKKCGSHRPSQIDSMVDESDPNDSIPNNPSYDGFVKALFSIREDINQFKSAMFDNMMTLKRQEEELHALREIIYGLINIVNPPTNGKNNTKGKH